MNIKQFIDATYLKTPHQANLTKKENEQIVVNFVNEAIKEKYKLVMLRPEMVTLAKEIITKAKSKVAVGTVISFPKGINTLQKKIAETQKAIANNADEIDVVCNYKEFIKGNSYLVKEEVLVITKLILDHNKTVKWIIEIAALNDTQIIKICTLIKNVIIANFKEECYHWVFIKSSTGFYKTINGKPTGATLPAIIIMLENGSPLQIKASGGIKNYQQAMQMIQLGVKRIGTSSAKEISKNQTKLNEY